MTTIREKYLEKIKEDFEVLSTIVLQQMGLVISATHDNKDSELYTKIEQNEVIIDGLEVKIRDEVINSIVLYSPRASDCRKIMSYHDMTAYLERIGDLLLNIADFLREVELQGSLYASFQPILLLQLETVKKMTQNAIFAFTWQKRLSGRMTSWTTTTKKSPMGYLFTLSAKRSKTKICWMPFPSVECHTTLNESGTTPQTLPKQPFI